MKCPACKDILVAVELGGVEVDLCDACKGAWLDRGELELLSPDPRDATGFAQGLRPVFTSRERPRRCPICGIRMTKAGSAWDPAIVVDRCPRNDGIWFDRGELVKVLGVREKSDKVQDFLSGIFDDPQSLRA